MPDPIQSNAPSSRDFSCNDNDDAQPLGPRCQPESSSEQRALECDEPGSLSHELVTSYLAKTPSTVGNINSERVAQTPLELGHTASGVTENGSVFASAALLYGRAGDFSLEVGSCSIQDGAQTEAQCALLRVTRQGADGHSETLELLSAQAGAGSHNKDGSIGSNASAGASLFGLETTTRLGSGSATVGVAFGPALDASSGVRDSDGDGALERCLRAGTTALGGGCVEDAGGWRR